MEDLNKTPEAEFVEVKKPMSRKKVNAIKSVLLSTYTILISCIYVVLGLFIDWSPYWLIFLTIPIYASLIEAILRKRPEFFSVESLAVGIYLVVAVLTKVWHPTWVILMIIPIYRSTVSSVKKIKYIKEND